MTNVDPALMKQILDIPERQREADVEHHPQADYLGTRPELLKRGKFCHDRTLRGALPVSMRVCLTGFKEVFGDAGKAYVFHCASDLRSALTVATLQDMRFDAAHLKDGSCDCLKASGAVVGAKND